MTVPDSVHAHNLTVDVSTTGDGVSVQSLKIEETNSSTTVSESNQSDGNSKEAEQIVIVLEEKKKNTHYCN